MANFWFTPKAIVVYAVSLLALAEIVDLTIVSVAIPQIMGSLGTDLNSVAIVTTSYVVAAAIFIPLSGIVTRKYGMKRVILLSALLFTISSILCGIATSLTEMVIFRTMQGIGGAFLPSLAQSYIAKSFSGREAQKMMTLFGLIVVMGPVLGPVLGGALTENLSWRWVFYVNIPICVPGFLLILFFMENELKEDIEIDHISFIFMALGIGCLEYFIDEGKINHWFESIKMLIILAMSIISLSFFVWRWYLGKSVANLNLFKNLNFTLSCFAMLIFMAAVTGALAYFPTMLQQVYFYPVDTAGYITVPRGLAAVLASPFIPLLANKIGTKLTMFLGILGFSISCFMLASYAPKVSQSYIIITMLVQGVSMMAFFLPIVQICFIGFTEKESSDVSGVFNFFRNFGCSIGTSIAATVVSHQIQVNYHDMGSHISPYSNGFAWWSQHLFNVPEQLQVAIAQAQMLLQGLIISYLDSFYFFGIVLVFMLWIPFTLKQPDNASSQVAEIEDNYGKPAKNIK